MFTLIYYVFIFDIFYLIQRPWLWFLITSGHCCSSSFVLLFFLCSVWADMSQTNRTRRQIQHFSRCGMAQFYIFSLQNHFRNAEYNEHHDWYHCRGYHSHSSYDNFLSVDKYYRQLQQHLRRGSSRILCNKLLFVYHRGRHNLCHLCGASRNTKLYSEIGDMFDCGRFNNRICVFDVSHTICKYSQGDRKCQ